MRVSATSVPVHADAAAALATCAAQGHAPHLRASSIRSNPRGIEFDGRSLYGEGQSWHEGKGPFEVRKGPVLKMSKDGGACSLSGMCACD